MSPGGDWVLRSSSEAESLLAWRHDELRLVLVAGSQIATRDRLEVLALLSTTRFDGRPTLDDAIAEVQAAGALAVVPWGFGKWTLRRRTIVERALEHAPRPFFLGDNGGRLRLAPMPRLLRGAAAAGIPVLPGSDPLPFPDQQTRAGSYGFVAEIGMDVSAPTGPLREWLRRLTRQPAVFGQAERPAAFLRNQLRMQLHKRRST